MQDTVDHAIVSLYLTIQGAPSKGGEDKEFRDTINGLTAQPVFH